MRIDSVIGVRTSFGSTISHGFSPSQYIHHTKGLQTPTAMPAEVPQDA